MPDALLDVEHLTTALEACGREVPVVDDLGLSIAPRETLALVGESGSGKSLAALSIVRLLPPAARITRGTVRLRGRNLVDLSERDMRAVRGAQIGFVFQEPSAALNPVLTIGDQVAEALVLHGRATWREARRQAVDLLASVSVPDPARRARQYAHELSGGLRQRAMIAAAIACRPALLIADEPTTALDVTIQAEVLDLLAGLTRDPGLGLLLITHDLGIVAQRANRVAIMYTGQVVEEAAVRTLFSSPAHPYTRALIASVPGVEAGTRLRAIDGHVPSPGTTGAGCAFAPRCPDRHGACVVRPALLAIGTAHTVRCHLHGDTGLASAPAVAVPQATPRSRARGA